MAKGAYDPWAVVGIGVAFAAIGALVYAFGQAQGGAEWITVSQNIAIVLVALAALSLVVAALSEVIHR